MMKKWVLRLLSLFLLLLAAAVQFRLLRLPRPATWEEKHEQIAHLVQEGLIYDARDQLQDLYRDQNNLEDLLELARLSGLLRDEMGQKDYYREAIRKYPSDLRAYDLLVALEEDPKESAVILAAKAKIVGYPDDKLQAYELSLEGTYLEGKTIVFGQGKVFVQADANHYGLVSRDGGQILPAMYGHISLSDTSELYAVTDGGQAYLVDDNGNKRLFSPQPADWVGPYQERTLIKRGQRYRYLDQHFQDLEGDFDDASLFSSQGQAFVKTGDGWRLRNQDGHFSSQDSYETVYLDSQKRAFVAGRALVKRAGQWQILSEEHQSIPIQEDLLEVKDLTESRFLGRTAGGWGIFKLDGQRALPESFDQVSGGYKDYVFAKQAVGQWQLINGYGRKGEVILAEQVSFVPDTPLVRLRQDGHDTYQVLCQVEEKE